LKVHGFRSAMVHFSPHYVGFGLIATVFMRRSELS
jgi:hypothetical protein